MRWLFILLTALLTPFAAAATCQPDSGTIQTRIACSEQLLQQETRRLQQIIERVAASQSPQQRRQLEQEQQQWQQHSRQECYFDPDGPYAGPMMPFLRNNCLIGLTRKRSNQLKNYQDEYIVYPDQLQWLDSKTRAAFTCEAPLTARVGLQPVIQRQNNQQQWYARLQIGESWLNFPIGTSQDPALCSKQLTLQALESHQPCPALKINHGQCSPLILYWSPAEQTYLWKREPAQGG